jgi:hypothetical protein
LSSNHQFNPVHDWFSHTIPLDFPCTHFSSGAPNNAIYMLPSHPSALYHPSTVCGLIVLGLFCEEIKLISS